MLSRTVPSVHRILQRYLIYHRSFSTVTSTNPLPSNSTSSTFDPNLLPSHDGTNTSHMVPNHSPLEYIMRSILKVHDVNMEQIYLIQKNDFHNRMDHFQKLLMEVQSCVMDFKISENRMNEDEIEARASVKELYFEFLEIVDDLNSMNHDEDEKITRRIQQVEKRLDGVEDRIDECNPLKLHAIISNIYVTSKLIRDIV